jgi:UDP-glucose 4-epimerase
VVRLLGTDASINEVFNVGNDREVTMNQLAAMVRDAAGSTSPIVHLPYESNAAGFEDMQRRLPDVRKLERVTGFRPTTPLEQIITDVVAEQRANLVAVA